ncbi:hypothetical protein WJX73_005694 [Symbiochloris irregularis]|uniref:RRM domain-containing protein n=1 Tax=Symbiochloris irregularis TaxID=706552 RepID=A0AAW1NMV3_9CHLO
MAGVSIVQDSPQGRALQEAVQKKLRDFLGEGFSDDVLPLYIVVMLAHGNDEALVAHNLIDFLQAEPAKSFSAWLFKHVADNKHAYAAQAPAPAPATTPAYSAPAADVPASPAQQDAEEAAPVSQHHTEKRREKIQWRGDDDGATPASPGQHRRQTLGRQTLMEGDARPERKRGRGDQELAEPAERQRQRREDRGREEPHHQAPNPRDRGDRDRYREREREREWGARAGHDWDTARPDARRGREGWEAGSREQHRRGHRSEEMSHDDWQQGGRGKQGAAWEQHADAVEQEPRRDRDRERGRDRDRDRDKGRGKHAETNTKAWEVDERPRSQRILNEKPSPPHHASTKMLDAAVRSAAADTVAPRDRSVKERASVFSRIKDVGRAEDGAQDDRGLSNGKAGASNAITAGGLASRLGPPMPPSLNGNTTQPGATGGDVDMQDLASMRAAMKAMEAQLAEIRSQREVAEAEQAKKDACSVRVSHLHASIGAPLITAHFSKCGVVKSVDLDRDESGAPKGSASVVFSTPFEANMALALAGSELNAHRIVVMPKAAPKPAQQQQQPPYQQPFHQPRPYRPYAAPSAPWAGRGMSWRPPRPAARGMTYVRPGLTTAQSQASSLASQPSAGSSEGQAPPVSAA